MARTRLGLYACIRMPYGSFAGKSPDATKVNDLCARWVGECLRQSCPRYVERFFSSLANMETGYRIVK
jgi:hypothetical protein